jgi:hypothetical protein
VETPKNIMDLLGLNKMIWALLEDRSCRVWNTNSCCSLCRLHHQGNTPGTKTEEYNGTSWTAGNDMSIGNNNGAGTAGIETAAFFGGASPPTGSTEEYDGTNWSERWCFRIQREVNLELLEL